MDEDRNEMEAPQYRNAREYAQSLRGWLYQYRSMATMNFVHTFMTQQMLMTSFGPMGQMQGANLWSSPVQHDGSRHRDSTAVNVNRQGTPNQAAGADRQNDERQGQLFRIPVLWKRVAAEMLDFIFLLYIKLIVTVAVVRHFGHVDENLIHYEIQLPFIIDITEMDYDKIFTLTSEVIALEIVNRICITIVEAFCLRQGFNGTIGGATPGKKVMRLKVISFDNLIDHMDGRVFILNPRNAGFIRSFIRSVIKNFSIAFFFPACLTVFFLKLNRATYDVLANTIVVEANDPPN
ncbi:hypothetical protein CHS0354_036899 [Potamilus streckersoni]|uniref:RDD domain-containing protein n=1 Tax=Potamilus streckersoni TaxID=2493646 RepID=A0AAE0RU03_9BIVA|nr:hypothetical protein CHS0354_036899 [Potamilus streckersoni]